MAALKQNWPTPAETLANANTDSRHSEEISFLQPSVVLPSPQPATCEGVLHTKLDAAENRDIPAPIPNIHIFAQTLEEEVNIGNEMHPAILSQLKPCKTEKDHDCLYNAICLCLGMQEAQQYVLREKTALCLQMHSNHFAELLKASDEISLQALIKQCRQPSCFEGWGSEFHILALAIVLRRNIIVYTTFKNPKGQFYQRKNKNIVGLAEEFSKGGEKIAQHTNFEPQKGITCHKPIFLLLNGNHFTALVPRLPNPIYCVPPATNLPSIPNNGMLDYNKSSVQCKKMTRKARWLASKTPTQLAEYKAMEKVKKKNRKLGQESKHTVEIVHEICEQGSKEKCVKQGYDEKCHETETEDSDTILSSTATHCATLKQQKSSCTGKRKGREMNSVEDKSCYKKIKGTENDACIVPCIETHEVQKNGNPSKMTKAEINRRYYEKHKDKIKEVRREKYDDPEKQMAELAAQRKSYRDPANHAAVLAKRKAAYAVPEKHMAKLAAERKSYSDPVKHATVLARKKAAYAVLEKRTAKLAAERMSYRDPVNHATVLAKRKATYALPEKRMAKLAGKRKFHENPVNHELVLKRRRILYKMEVTKGPKQEKKAKSSKCDYTYLLSEARKAMLEMPILACTVCHRARFKEQVRLCHRNKYPTSDQVQKCFTGKYMHKCSAECNDSSTYHDKKKKEWICHTCHRHLLKGNMPPQADINKLWLDDMTKELKTLKSLEMHLVSIVQPFMKIVPLPRGAQKGVRGQMVCVPANLQRTADSLPWTLDTHNLIRVKLKRKQEYKGHHLYMVVSQEKVMAALRKLMEINPAYKGKSSLNKQLINNPLIIP